MELLGRIDKAVDSFSNSLSRTEYQDIQQDLSKGYTNHAFQAFIKISVLFLKEKSGLSMRDAAQAKFLMGKIAVENLQAQKAFRFFKQAVRFEPENIEYLFELGKLANQLALYTNAIQYLEAAEILEKKRSDADKALLLAILDNLSSAWQAKGDEKKSRYYKNEVVKLKQVGSLAR